MSSSPVPKRQPAASFATDPYPGEIPPWSFAVAGGAVIPLASSAPDYALPGRESLTNWLAERGPHVALLSYGSNACPGRIVEKFGRAADGFVVFPSMLCGAVRAWSCNRSSRGSVPATLVHSPGSHEPAHLLLMPASQAGVMDRSEGRGGPFYRLVRLEQAVVRLPDHSLWSNPLTYLGHAARGPLVVADSPLRCAETSQAKAAQLIDGHADCTTTSDRFLPPHHEVPSEESLLDASLLDRAGPLSRWLDPCRTAGATDPLGDQQVGRMP